MNRRELEVIKDTLRKGVRLEGFDVMPKPASRPGYMWEPIYSAEDSAIGWQEVVDPNYVPSHEGTYIDPIIYTEGMSVVTGLFYTDGEDIWEAIKDGIPANFSDAEYFDIIAA